MYFFYYFKNSLKVQTASYQYQKLYNTPPPPRYGARIKNYTTPPPPPHPTHDMVHVSKTFLRKYSNAFLSYSAKTKHDGQTDTSGFKDYFLCLK